MFGLVMKEKARYEAYEERDITIRVIQAKYSEPMEISCRKEIQADYEVTQGERKRVYKPIYYTKHQVTEKSKIDGYVITQVIECKDLLGKVQLYEVIV